MMERLLRRGEAVAAQRVEQTLENIARAVRDLVGDATVQVEGTRVLVRAPGIVKRWLIDPSLRFAAGAVR